MITGPSPIPRKAVFTTGEVAAVLRTSIQRVDRWIDGGDLAGYRIPGSTARRVTRESLVAFARERGITLATRHRVKPVGALDQRLYTTGQVARALHVCRKVVRRWIDCGLLKGFRLDGGDRRVTHASLTAFAFDHDLLHHLHRKPKGGRP